MRTFALSIQNTQSAQSNGVQRGIALKAAMVAAACREFHEHSISGPLQGPSVLDEVGQKVAVIEAGLRTHAALVGGRPTTALASAIGALRQLNRAVNDAKHGDEVCRPRAQAAAADTAQTHMQRHAT